MVGHLSVWPKWEKLKDECKWLLNIKAGFSLIAFYLHSFWTYYSLLEKFGDNIVHHSSLQEQHRVNNFIAKKKNNNWEPGIISVQS